MCGIAGIIRFDETPANHDQLLRMSGRIAHRGPDDSGVYVSGPVALAHRRLSILDLSNAAHQPMWDATGTAAIIYNGEVYNFRELRARLEKEGCTFHSTGDTEVLLQACRMWGPTEAARLADGMFGFAYWDAREQELWLARDRTGIKPVYYHRTSSRLIFASEIKALLGEIDAQPDERALTALLLGTPLHDPHTPFTGVRALEAGATLCIRPTGEVTPGVFYSLAEAIDRNLYEELDRMSDDQVIGRIGQLMDQSVLLHLASDAQVGVMASGGLDSSVVAAISGKHMPRLNAYHADVSGPLSERKWAEILAKHAGLPLHVASLSPDSFVQNLAAVTYANECPVSFHPNTVPFYLVCDLAAREGIKVLLTGEGADELFGGYPSFRSHLRRRRIEAWRDRLSAGLSRLGLGKVGRLMRWLTETDAHYGMRSRNSALLTGGRSLVPYTTAGELYGFVKDPIEREFHADLFAYLHSYLQSILWRNDRMGMVVGLESRVPFLENELIRHAVNLPMRFKVRGKENKWVLRRVAEKHLPTELVHRPKMGFPVDAQGTLRPAPELFRGGFLESYLDIGPRQLAAVTSRYSESQFALLSAEIWGQMYFQGQSVESVTERMLRALSPTATPGCGPLTKPVTVAGASTSSERGGVLSVTATALGPSE